MSGSALTARNSQVIITDAGGFVCEEGDTLLRAALRAGVAAPYECNSGGCGTCKFLPRSGEFRQVHDEPAGLTARDRRKGRALACQSVPLGDCRVELNVSTGESSAVAPQVRAGVVVDRRQLTHDLVELTVKTADPAAFLPGQYAMVSLDRGDWVEPVDRLRAERAYSMSNLPNPGGYWQFQIKDVPGGSVSGPLSRTAKVGSGLRLDGPFGHAHLKETARDIVCIAGGSGLAPMVSIARGFAAQASAYQRQLHFFYGGRAPRDLCAREFFDEVAGQLEQATLVEVLSEAGLEKWDGLRGFVHEALRAADLPDLAARDIYVAGPPIMTDAVVRMLTLELSIPVEQIHYDRFF